jgi:hypothetical protein
MLHALGTTFEDEIPGVVMTELLSYVPAARCQADQPCDRAPCFQARLEATAERCLVRRHAELCVEHLGDAVQAMTAWARSQGLEGKVTVLAIDQPPPGQAPSPALPGDRAPCGFAFGTILLDP